MPTSARAILHHTDQKGPNILKGSVPITYLLHFAMRYPVVKFCVTNITGEIPLFLVNCLHVLCQIALSYKTSSTNLTNCNVLVFWMRIFNMLFQTRICSMSIFAMFAFEQFFKHVFCMDMFFQKTVQVNLCQKLLFLHQLTHKYDDRLFIELQVQYMKIPSSEHGENMGTTCCAHKLF